ncbi:MAG: hypothetical protein KatS3mg015_1969 [Fimbriimonadales bacterium]|nr:MAG: hypothetical protein KatS3mg015_1969 [Fimbriimonadales bacterium]
MSALLLGLTLALAQVSSPQYPLTKAEASNYRQTSTLEDVMSFVRTLQQLGAPIRVETVGKSAEGRDIPLIVCAQPAASTPASAHRLGRVVVYIQANIHGGEVEGKEAAQMVLRDLAKDPSLLENLVVLVCPVYNTDGNEKFGDGRRNRPSQDGPEQVGERANGQGLDLNRDAVKAESPEMQAMLERVYNAWDPAIMMDLHTTNGTRHGYHLTYSPPLNPNSDPALLALVRDKMLPEIRAKAADAGWRLFDYGNVQNNGWYTYGQEGRYVTNYVGLRNRIGILSEAMSYLPFEQRIAVTKWFVDAVLRYASDNATVIQTILNGADLEAAQLSGKPLGVRFEPESRGEEPVLLEKQGTARGLNIGELESVRMPIYDRFRSTLDRTAPEAWVLMPDQEAAAQLLARHGIVVERTLVEWTADGEWLSLTEIQRARNPFQGHRLVRLEGSWEKGSVRVPKGAFLIRSRQPLARLAFHMLEPESLDGLIAWEIVPIADDAKTAPILRIAERPAVPCIRFP